MKQAMLAVIVCGLLGCGAAQHGAAQGLESKSFQPLKGNEIFTYSKTTLNDRGAIILMRTDPKRKTSKELARIANFDMGKVEIVENGKKAYFVVMNEDPSGLSELWVADGGKGTAYPLMKASSSFGVSPNGQFICYEDLENIAKKDSNYPRVVLFDIKKGKGVKYFDYTEKKYEGTGVDISFDVKKGRFHLEFGIEDRTVGVDDIELPKAGE